MTLPEGDRRARRAAVEIVRDSVGALDRLTANVVRAVALT